VSDRLHAAVLESVRRAWLAHCRREDPAWVWRLREDERDDRLRVPPTCSRGLPAVGRGVQGAIRGTRPDVALFAKEQRCQR
jgi:hypothetical protein